MCFPLGAADTLPKMSLPIEVSTIARVFPVYTSSARMTCVCRFEERARYTSSRPSGAR
jgi:hypothetical protein